MYMCIPRLNFVNTEKTTLILSVNMHLDPSLLYNCLSLMLRRTDEINGIFGSCKTMFSPACAFMAAVIALEWS